MARIEVIATSNPRERPEKKPTRNFSLLSVIIGIGSSVRSSDRSDVSAAVNLDA